MLALARVYTFARFVDDVGDEADGDRPALLEVVDADVRALWTGKASLAARPRPLPISRDRDSAAGAARSWSAPTASTGGAALLKPSVTFSAIAHYQRHRWQSRRPRDRGRRQMRSLRKSLR